MESTDAAFASGWGCWRGGGGEGRARSRGEVDFSLYIQVLFHAELKLCLIKGVSGLFQFFPNLLASSQLNEVCQSHRALPPPERQTSISCSDIWNPWRRRRWKCSCQKAGKEGAREGVEKKEVEREREKGRRGKVGKGRRWQNGPTTCCSPGQG